MRMERRRYVRFFPLNVAAFAEGRNLLPSTQGRLIFEREKQSTNLPYGYHPFDLCPLTSTENAIDAMQVQLEHRSPPRTTTASRSPPILPPGMPVKSGHFGSFVSSQQQTSSGGSSALPATGVIHKVSNSDLKQSATGSDSSHMFRRPSPPSSTDSHGPPSRTNSRFSFQKRGSESSRGSVEGCASPESDLVTPREVYTAQVDVVDDLNAQFEHLLVSKPTCSTANERRIPSKSLHPSGKSSASFPPMSNHRSSLQIPIQIPHYSPLSMRSLHLLPRQHPKPRKGCPVQFCEGPSRPPASKVQVQTQKSERHMGSMARPLSSLRLPLQLICQCRSEERQWTSLDPYSRAILDETLLLDRTVCFPLRPPQPTSTLLASRTAKGSVSPWQNSQRRLSIGSSLTRGPS